jgi:hypothetical protein
MPAKVIDNNKDTSLIYYGIDYARKRFYDTGPRAYQSEAPLFFKNWLIILSMDKHASFLARTSLLAISRFILGDVLILVLMLKILVK